MQIKEINSSADEKKEWEEFLLRCSQKTFLHSWNWGEFQNSLGYRIWRWGIYENEELISVALVIRHKARRGSFLLVPHGPVLVSNSIELDTKKREVVKVVSEKLKDLAKKERVDFVRISPIWGRSDENKKIFKELGFRVRPLHTHPESSWKLNIEPSEDALLAGMRKTTRYLIRQAEKEKDLKVYQSVDVRDVEAFNTMHLKVVQRQQFVPFSLEYFKKEFEAFSKDNQIALLMARYQGRVIAASYGIFWQDMAFYHHAALLPEYKKIPAAYLLQWHSIKEAKKRGCKVYDFWGYADPVTHPRHPYAGPTLFKMGFGGYKEEYVKAQDLVVSPKYWFNYLVETARKIRRGL